MTGLKIVRAIVLGDRVLEAPAAMRDVRCSERVQTLRKALVGNDQPDHVLALAQCAEIIR